MISKIYDEHKAEIDGLTQKHSITKKALEDKQSKLNGEIIRLKDEIERANRIG